MSVTSSILNGRYRIWWLELGKTCWCIQAPNHALAWNFIWGRNEPKLTPLHFVLLCYNHLTFTLMQIPDNYHKERKQAQQLLALKRVPRGQHYLWGCAWCRPWDRVTPYSPSVYTQTCTCVLNCIGMEAATLRFKVTLRGMIKKSQAWDQESWDLILVQPFAAASNCLLSLSLCFFTCEMKMMVSAWGHSELFPRRSPSPQVA